MSTKCLVERITQYLEAGSEPGNSAELPNSRRRAQRKSENLKSGIRKSGISKSDDSCISKPKS